MVERVKGDPVADQIVVTEQTASAASQSTTASDTPEGVSEADSHDMAKKAREALEKAEGEETQAATAVETVKVEENGDTAATATEQAEEAAEQAVTQAETQAQAGADTTEATAEQVEATAAEAGQASESAAGETVVVEENNDVVPAAETEQAAEAEAEAEPEPQAPAEPVVMNEKVVLKAVDYAWIQVTDQEGSVVHTQVLNQGEEYQIPAKTGLILRTGNAGGLEIFVDGEKVPSVGDAGEVRRKIHLNPEKLIAGTAVES
ncbi:DUF4115 domain-containing protein [Terasakiella pusilla]|uniref:DUF4115 domain-containing protein n=1 Tax=Terasakiella pusilla TaxID=64973 RepID=UPI003AA8970F